ncbi:MAG: hypothetical protein WCO78_01650 [Candidatus Roizmanbacteria bacterium]
MKISTTSIIVIAIVILGIAFYWYELRPAQIRTWCINKVSVDKLYRTTEAESKELQGNMVKINTLERDKSDFWYKDCLRNKGIKD